MNGSIPTNKIKHKYKLRVTASTPGRKNIPIDSKVFRFLLEHRTSYLSRPSGHNAKPWCALLGTDEFECVRMLVKIYPGYGGCWNMPEITPEVFADSAIKLATRGFKISGLVRIGKFNLGGVGYTRGPSLQEFGKEAPGFYIVSLGLEGMNIETWSRGRVMKHGWLTVRGGEYHGQQSKAASGQGQQNGNVQQDDQGDVRQADGTGSVRGAEQSDNSRRVSQQETDGVQLSGSSEPNGRADGLRPEGPGYCDNDQQGVRRPRVRRASRTQGRPVSVQQPMPVRDSAEVPDQLFEKFKDIMM